MRYDPFCCMSLSCIEKREISVYNTNNYNEEITKKNYIIKYKQNKNIQVNTRTRPKCRSGLK